MKIINLILIICINCTFIISQSDSTKVFSVSGYGELYYNYNFSEPQNHEKANFLYNYKRHNELNLNLAYIKGAYHKENVHGNIALMAGNYAHYNLAAEPLWAQFIYEANFGVKISKKYNLWLDAGILPSHIGFESAVGADCWALSRSIMAELSPYYEAGLRLKYVDKNEKINVSFLVLNGWQNIKRQDGMQIPSFGLQVNYTPTPAFTLNYSNFIGTDKPDSIHAMRVFHNFYAIYQLNSDLGFTLGFDLGSDKYDKYHYGIWYTPVFLTRFRTGNKTKLCARLEYYNDPKQIKVSTNTDNGFKVFGASLNFDYQINELVLWRTEFKYYTSKDKIFDNLSKTNDEITTSFSIKL